MKHESEEVKNTKGFNANPNKNNIRKTEIRNEFSRISAID